MGSLMNWPGHSEEEQADLVTKEGDAARVVSVESIEVCCGGVVVDERVLGSALKLLGTEFLGVCVDCGNVVNVGNGENSKASKTKPFRWIV